MVLEGEGHETWGKEHKRRERRRVTETKGDKTNMKAPGPVLKDFGFL